MWGGPSEQQEEMQTRVGERINTISACIHQEMSVEKVALFPVGTLPVLTAGPVTYQLTNPAETAIQAMKNK